MTQAAPQHIPYGVGCVVEIYVPVRPTASTGTQTVSCYSGDGAAVFTAGAATLEAINTTLSAAAAAGALVPLAINDERMAIISGHCEDTFIGETLETFDTVVFLKVNSVFDRLLDILEEKKLVANSVYVDRCTTEEEVIVRDIRTLKGIKLDYLSLLIVRK